jgi:hypothetical protein
MARRAARLRVALVVQLEAALIPLSSMERLGGPAEVETSLTESMDLEAPVEAQEGRPDHPLQVQPVLLQVLAAAAAAAQMASLLVPVMPVRSL